MAAIVTENLTKFYGRHAACAGINIVVAEGEVFGFLGPNGAGKSTLVKTLVGLLRPSSGRAWLLGRLLGDVAVRRRIGYLPENFRYHDWLTGAELLSVHGALCGLSPAERRRRIPEVLAMVGLAGHESRKIRDYSKGMQQRIGVACALMGDPDLLFLDEPTSALDPLGRRDMRELMLRLRARGKTIFLNSHLLSEVEMICDTVAIINKGEIVAQGALDELLAPGVEVEMEVEGVTPALEAALAAGGRTVRKSGNTLRVAVQDRTDIPALARLAVEYGGALYRLQSVQRSLENLFVDVVEGRY
ncbi:MAG: ABC transporter ATP-binding protein [Desulfotomaculales bacterium]